MTTFDPRALEAAAHAVWGSIDDSAIRGRLYSEDCDHVAATAITAYLAVTQPIVETVEELEELPVGAVIRCHSGTILESFEAWEAGLIWCPTEDDGARKSREVPLPARVIWRPHD